MPAVRFGSTLTALGVNIIRAAAYRAAAKRRKASLGKPFPFSKELISTYLPKFGIFCYFRSNHADAYPKLIA